MEIYMGQARQRKEEIMALKSVGNSGKNTAIHFNFKIAEYEYNLLAVYEPQIIKQMKADKHDAEKCLDIIMDCSQNLLAVKNGADRSDPRAGKAIENSMRGVALAVMRHAILDPYKSVGLLPDCVLIMTLEEDADGRVGYNLLDGDQSMFLMKRGVQHYIDSAEDIDFVARIG